jgi:DNA-binding LytR/AlgR family response regulator
MSKMPLSGSAEGCTTARLWRELALLAARHDAATAVDEGLALLGRHHDVDRVWVVRYNEELTHLWNTHEWSRDEVSSHVEDLQGASVDFIRWLHGQLLEGKTVVVKDVEALPRQARGFQAELRRQKIRSSINVPLVQDGKLRGIYGYDMVRKLGEWPDETIALLKEAAPYFTALLHGTREGTAEEGPVHPSTKTIHIHSSGSVVAMNRDELILIEADGDYTHLHFSGQRSFTELRSLKSWEKLLPEEEFLRINQKSLIHHGRIRELEKSGGEWLLHLNGWPHALPVGRTYRPRVRQHLGF